MSYLRLSRRITGDNGRRLTQIRNNTYTESPAGTYARCAHKLLQITTMYNKHHLIKVANTYTGVIVILIY